MARSCGRRLRIRVVFPEPRKPVIIVMGIGGGVVGTVIFAGGWELVWWWWDFGMNCLLY